ncbi:MAG: virion core protein, T7 gp14 family [Methylocystis sp.]|uniref:virion core protein, T7 gp14 family n=1 Tax=Methylocystis sp. TaxID=1911079 RepID=UPI003DA1F29D
MLSFGINAGTKAFHAGVGYNADRDATNRYNQSVALNAQSAGIAASNQYGDLGRQFTYEARTAQQEAQQAVQQGRQAQGTALASAGASGFTGSSLTVGAVMADEARRVAENEQNYGLKVDDLKGAYGSKGKMVQAQAQDRINSMSYQTQPSGVALGLNIASSVAGAGAKYFKNKSSNDTEY